MDPHRIYDYLAQSRRKLFERARPLTAAQYGRTFPIGPGTIGRALTHIMISEWYYVERMEQREVPPYEQWPIQWEHPPPFPDLEAAWSEQVQRTRAALAAVRDWGAAVEYRVTEDDGRAMIVTASAADLFTQLALHEVHHRAQVLNMLRQLGVEADDLDFNAMMMARREASPGRG